VLHTRVFKSISNEPTSALAEATSTVTDNLKFMVVVIVGLIRSSGESAKLDLEDLHRELVKMLYMRNTT
jgi:hypothetical protein